VIDSVVTATVIAVANSIHSRVVPMAHLSSDWYDNLKVFVADLKSPDARVEAKIEAAKGLAAVARSDNQNDQMSQQNAIVLEGGNVALVELLAHAKQEALQWWVALAITQLVFANERAIESMVDFSVLVTKLEVTVVRAKDLIAADRGGTSDPYVKVNVGAVGKGQRTKVQKRTLHPEWNESFHFLLGEKSFRQSLNVECIDWDAVGGDDSLGSFEIPLASLSLGRDYVEWRKLEGGERGEGRTKDGQNNGQVEVRYRLSPAGRTNAMEEAFAGLKVSELESAKLEAREHQTDEGHVPKCLIKTIAGVLSNVHGYTTDRVKYGCLHIATNIANKHWGAHQVIFHHGVVQHLNPIIRAGNTPALTAAGVALLCCISYNHTSRLRLIKAGVVQVCVGCQQVRVYSINLL